MVPDDSTSGRVEPGESDSQRSAASLRCPVCRARQPLQPTCRRCDADLRLLVAALRELDRLRTRHARALAKGDQQAANQIADRLRELQG